MAKNSFIIVILTAWFMLIPPSVPAQVSGPGIKIQDNNIMVGAGFFNTKEIETAIKSGVEKEIIFSIELFRVWSFWPDEFVVAKKIQKVIKYDNLRGQYRASSYDGTFLKERYFRDFRTLKEWVFTIKDINLVNIRELEEGRYFIRVIVESRSRELPPVIGLLLMFIPEREMSLAKESGTFNLGETR